MIPDEDVTLTQVIEIKNGESNVLFTAPRTSASAARIRQNIKLRQRQEGVKCPLHVINHKGRG